MKQSRTQSNKTKGTANKLSLVRKKRVSILLNDMEYKALEKYCSKYKVVNRAKLIREFLMRNILTRMAEDYPTLFAEEEMR